jgi:6-pyruvoyl-tetrahydropterin synthase
MERAKSPLNIDFVSQQVYYLNESTNLENPTSEELARWIFNYLQEDGLESLYAVEICETCTSVCIYFGENNDYYNIVK